MIATPSNDARSTECGGPAPHGLQTDSADRRGRYSAAVVDDRDFQIGAAPQGGSTTVASAVPGSVGDRLRRNVESRRFNING